MSEILGIFGLQGWGKTALTTYFGMKAKEMGYTIYSNYPVSFDYEPVTTIKEAQSVRNGYLLLDEIWQWVHARTSQSKINKEMMEICLLNRKRGISIIYNTQLRRTIDVILREVTTYRYLPQMQLHDDGKYYIHYIMKDLLDRESNEMTIPYPIDVIGNWFNTNYEVGKLSNEMTPIQKGIGLEKDFNNVLQKSKKLLFTKLQENSGNKSEYKFDVLAVGKDKNYCFDVKSTFNSDGVSITEHGKAFEDKIKSLKRWNGKLSFDPYFAFPIINRNRTTRIYDWWICSLMDNFNYFRGLNSMPRYSALIKKSLKLKDSNLFT